MLLAAVAVAVAVAVAGFHRSQARCCPGTFAHGVVCCGPVARRYSVALDNMGPKAAVAETLSALREMYGQDAVPDVSHAAGCCWVLLPLAGEMYDQDAVPDVGHAHAAGCFCCWLPAAAAAAAKPKTANPTPYTLHTLLHPTHTTPYDRPLRSLWPTRSATGASTPGQGAPTGTTQMARPPGTWGCCRRRWTTASSSQVVVRRGGLLAPCGVGGEGSWRPAWLLRLRLHHRWPRV